MVAAATRQTTAVTRASGLPTEAVVAVVAVVSVDVVCILVLYDDNNYIYFSDGASSLR